MQSNISSIKLLVRSERRDELLRRPLKDFRDNWLLIKCCKGATLLPLNLLIQKDAQCPLISALRKLRCSKCGIAPITVDLRETAITGNAINGPGWSIQIPVTVEVIVSEKDVSQLTEMDAELHLYQQLERSARDEIEKNVQRRKANSFHWSGGMP